MLTLSIVWVVLATTVTVIAIVRKAPATAGQDAGAHVRESGRAVMLLAVIYGLMLLTGFIYISRFLVSSL